MGYASLQECVKDLEAHRQLRKIEVELDPNLEIGTLQRLVYQRGGPALLFTKVKNCEFPMLGNLFGTKARIEFLFRDTLPILQKFFQLKIDPSEAFKNPFRYAKIPFKALQLFPKKVSSGPVLERQISVAQLPPLKSWPKDGGAFITLPQVYTEDPASRGFQKSNLGMYRVQISGNSYQPNEVGLHYQIHRGIGVHHTHAKQRDELLPVAIFVGGPPALTVSAVMPLPEGISELSFAGVLGGRRLRMTKTPLALHADADFCLVGTIDPHKTKPEGPFGDHLGYYSLIHDFPVMQVEKVFCRKDAIWPFTTVGRPPQEDTTFGEFIHDLTGNVIPSVLPGIREVHAVDATGVHPLLLAIGSERYEPYRETKRPQEILTQANAILGQGQLSLAKYLWILDGNSLPGAKTKDVEKFLEWMLERLDWKRDLHFQTQTTIDTLDYSGSGLNQGSKVIWAAAGAPVYSLCKEVPSGISWPEGFTNPRLAAPGVLVIQGPKFNHSGQSGEESMAPLCQMNLPPQIRWCVVVDDSDFASRNFNQFLWVTFTRSNPASDTYGIGAQIHDKHWGCRGALITDARLKPHMAPPLEEDPKVIQKIEDLAAKGKPLEGLL